MKIAEVSERYGISADTLRYYERIGLLPRVNRSESGVRDYNEHDADGWSLSRACNTNTFAKMFLVNFVGRIANPPAIFGG